mgnify:CR=1 FL=1
MDYPTHIVAVMGIVRNEKNEILLVKSPKRGWEPPGGQVENGEDLVTALKREIFEESGIECLIGNLLAVYSNVASMSTTKTKIMMMFEAIETGGELRTSSESVEVGWFSAGKAVELVDHPAQNLKLRDGIGGARVVYRTYTTKPFRVICLVKI